MRHRLMLVLVLLLAAMLSACGGTPAAPTSAPTNAPASAPTEATTAEATTAEATTAEATTAEATTAEATTAEATTEATTTSGTLPDLGGREVTIAVENAYPPFNYVNPNTGMGEGWDYEAWNEICRLLNCVRIRSGWVTPELRESVESGILPLWTSHNAHRN